VALAALTAELEPASTLAAVQRCWEGAVGAVVATAASPIAERSGVLEIACEDAVWAAELELMGPDIVAALNAAIGADVLRSVRVRASASANVKRRPHFG
jgi:predicted nucleic acid-binding Zn ribbon protein